MVQLYIFTFFFFHLLIYISCNHGDSKCHLFSFAIQVSNLRVHYSYFVILLEIPVLIGENVELSYHCVCVCMYVYV